MSQLNTNTLVLLVLILAILLFDFFRNRKSNSKELIDTTKQSNKKKLFIRVLLLVSLVAITFFIINKKNSIASNIALSSSPIEDFHKEFSALKFSDGATKEAALDLELSRDEYFEVVSSFFEKYYDCLECLEIICNTHPSQGNLDETYARYKIVHFTRAIELGSSDLDILVQDMRYKDFAGDNYGAKERSKQIQLILESLDESDIKRYYHSIGNYYLFQARIYDWEYSLVNSYHLIALQYYEKALDALSQENPLEIEYKANGIADKMIHYHQSFAQRSGGKYYWRYKFPEKDKREICRLMSRLGSLGAVEIYELMKELCSD